MSVVLCRVGALAVDYRCATGPNAIHSPARAWRGPISWEAVGGPSHVVRDSSQVFSRSSASLALEAVMGCWGGAEHGKSRIGVRRV